MNRGFTLLELIVALAIIGVLLAILLPTHSRMRSQALEAECRSNLRSHAQALEIYRQDWEGRFPATVQALYPPFIQACPLAPDEPYHCPFFCGLRGDLYESFWEEARKHLGGTIFKCEHHVRNDLCLGVRLDGSVDWVEMCDEEWVREWVEREMPEVAPERRE